MWIPEVQGIILSINMPMFHSVVVEVASNAKFCKLQLPVQQFALLADLKDNDQNFHNVHCARPQWIKEVLVQPYCI